MTDFYVATDGVDTSGGGTELEPWRTLDYAQDRVFAGDTLFIRGGLYREGSLSDWNAGTSADRITIRNYPGETPIISGGTLLDSIGDWTLETGDIYRHTFSGTARHMSQAGIPMLLMDTSNDGNFSLITGPGQWVRNTTTVWARVSGGGTLWDSDVELALVYGLIRTKRENNQPYITFDGITAECCYYPFQMEGDYSEILNCTARNCYADGIKYEGWAGPVEDEETPWYSTGCLIDNCDIYDFAEAGIDITGALDSTVTNNKIHDCVPRHAPTNDYDGHETVGLMIKNRSVGGLVSGNEFYNGIYKNGAMIFGPNTTQMEFPTAEDFVIEDNIIRDFTAPYAISFSGAMGNTFQRNTIRDCYILEEGELGASSAPEALIQFRDGFISTKDGVDDSFGTKRKAGENTILDNLFIDNRSTYAYKEYELYDLNNDVGNISNRNGYSGTLGSHFDETDFTRATLASEKGYDTEPYGSGMISNLLTDSFNTFALTLDNETVDETGDGATLTIDSNSDAGTLYSYSKTTAFTGTDEENAAEIMANGVGQVPVIGTNTRVVTGQDGMTDYYAGWVQDSEASLYGDNMAMEFLIESGDLSLALIAYEVTSDYNASISWGDGTDDSLITSFDDANLTHDYTAAGAGTYTVVISGVFPWLRLDGSTAIGKLKKIKQLGNVGAESFSYSFRGAVNADELTASYANHIATDWGGLFREWPGITQAPNIDGLLNGPPPKNIGSMLRDWTSAGAVDLSLDQWDMTHCTVATLFMSGSQLTTACYDRTLASWGNQTLAAGASTTTIHFGTSQYSLSSQGNRDLLEAQVAGIIDSGVAP